MDAVSSTVAADAASKASPGTVQASAAISMLKKSLDLQESEAAQLLQALPQPSLATSGSLGTQLDTYA
jgi:Putative motility protein